MEHLDAEKADGTGPLLDAKAERSDGRTPSLPSWPFLAATVAVVTSGGLVWVYREPLTMVKDWVTNEAAVARDGFLDYSTDDPLRYVAILGLTLGGFGVVLWLGTWWLAESGLFFVRTPASKKSVFGKALGVALGVLSLVLYVSDVWSDVLVAILLMSTANYIWSCQSIFLLLLQYGIVHSRVCEWWGKEAPRYRRNEKGEFIDEQGNECDPDEARLPFTWSQWFAWMPGVLVLDAVMLLEAFGVLRLLKELGRVKKDEDGEDVYENGKYVYVYGKRVGEWAETWHPRLEKFLPTYKATRIIAEVGAESTPQAVLQAYIFVRVMGGGGAQLAAHAAMQTHASILPISLAISVVNLLKVWLELLYAARTAKVPVEAVLVQIWEMGAGKLPLDAIRRSTIDYLEWGEPIPEAEWNLLVDAFLQNTSLTEVYLECSMTANQAASLAAVMTKGAMPQLQTLKCVCPAPLVSPALARASRADPAPMCVCVYAQLGLQPDLRR